MFAEYYANVRKVNFDEVGNEIPRNQYMFIIGTLAGIGTILIRKIIAEFI